MRLAYAVLLLSTAMAPAASAQSANAKTDADLKVEADKARAFYTSNNYVAALPLYEDLHAAVPANLAYEEALAMCLQGSGEGMTDAANKAAHARSKQLLLDAQSKGDDSPLLKTVLEKMGTGDGYAPPAANKTPAQEDFARAEKLFGSGQLKEANEAYRKALAEDPTFYVAALYAGDSLFKLGDCPQATQYYAKAVAIDPNRETAYRYWGDCLKKMGDNKRAEDMYIQAIISEPYQQTPRATLQEWAKLNHERVVPPAVTLPKRAVPDAKGNTTITIDPALMGKPASPAWIAYSIAPTIWQKGQFAKTYPNEKVYRHSLAEEAQAIRVALSAVKDKSVIADDPTLRTLAALDKDGMLECYILLDAPDQGIAQDYVAYRKDHRELMAQYIAKYDVHPA